MVDEEVGLLGRVHALLARGDDRAPGGPPSGDFERDLIALRDQIADEKPEDLASLVEQMTRVQALAAGRRSGKVALPIDAASPYFAHMRIRAEGRSGEPPREQDILIGRRGLIDRTAGVQIVDWRDAPVSQVYYRYDEGDDYDEEVSGGNLRGIVMARRNVTIAGGKLRRIGCPQGTFVASGEGQWFELSGDEVALLAGGQGTAARPPRPGPPQLRGRRRMEPARATSDSTKTLPEIAALIDRAQFDLITEPSTGLVVIQGGAGSGKTTVALHRIAYLVFHDPKNFKPSRCLFVVPSEALARYVAGVLPALGVQGVPVTTFRGWARNLRKRLVPSAPDRYAEDTPSAVSRLKKHPALLRLVEAAVDVELTAARRDLAARLGDVAGAPWVLEAWDKSADRPPVARARATRRLVERGGMDLPAATAHAAEQTLRKIQSRLGDVRRILFELYTDRGRLEALREAELEPAGVREIEEMVRWCTAQLEEASPAEFDGIDEDRLAPIDGLPLEDGSGEGGARARLDEEDDALLLRLYQLVHGELTRVDGESLAYDHIALDEAQDLSASEVKLLYHATNDRRSVTIAGDVAQRVIFDNAFRGWDALLGDVGVNAVKVRPLRLAYRSTAPVMRFARRVLGPLAAAEATDVEARPGAEVTLHPFDGMGEAVAFIADALRSLIGREPSASVALLTRHAGQADAWWGALARAEVPQLRRVRRQDFAFSPGVDVTDVGQVKGLEFDYVILLDVNDSSYPDSVEARHLLHIGATRATHQLWVVSTGRPSPLVADALDGEADEAGLPEEKAETTTEPGRSTSPAS
ncbi:MAG: UvrD/Rep helicase family protein [Myxococcales bacterium]|nr:UvrD/Rep helicase family protein [Myxococcales bacterium]